MMALLLSALAAAAPSATGVCVGQAWIDVRPGETVANIDEAGFEAAIVTHGAYRFAIVTRPANLAPSARLRRVGGRPGATVYALDAATRLVRTGHGDYLLTESSPDDGAPGSPDLIARVHFDEPGRAACRGWHGL